MFNAKKIVATAAIFGAGFAAFSTSSVVQAEPVSNSYTIVGSDTLEDVVDAIVNGTAITGATVRVTMNGATLGSFDATGTPYVVTKPGGVMFARPNGSGDGFMALSASMGGVTGSNFVFTSAGNPQAGFSSIPTKLNGKSIQGMVDIARSSSSDPKTTKMGTGTWTDSNSTIAGVPFGRDAIALAMSPALATALRTAEGLSATDVPYLTVAQLFSAYSCTGSATPTIDVNGTSISVNPVIPQYGSGTRKDFYSKTGLTDPGNGLTAACIGVGQEHDATATAFTSVTNGLMPMSASRWIAMQNGASFDRSGTAVLGSVATATTAGVALSSIVSGTQVASPVTGSGTSLSPNSVYYADTTWGRDVYLFVERARIDATYTAGGTITAGSKYDANLALLLNPTENTLSNSNTAGASKVGKVKLAFGFLAPKDSTTYFFGPKN